MKIPTMPMLWVPMLSLLVLFTSCDSNQEPPLDLLQDDSLVIAETESHSISIDQAKLLTGKLKFNATSNVTVKEHSEDSKSVREIKPISDEKGELLFYIINFDGGGFVLLSGDNRISPILAFSENSTFHTKSKDYPSGLVEWLVAVKDSIQLIRQLETRQSEVTKWEWENISMERLIGQKDKGSSTEKLETPHNPNYCEDVYQSTSPFLKTKWGQGCGYNDLLPYKPCTNECNRAWAGCVPVAIAQVMKHFKFPPQYNWQNMPNSGASYDTALLIRDIHNIINPITYNCASTGVNKDYNTAGLFKSNFGYSNAKQSSLNRDIVSQEIKWGYPVILGGGKNSGWWIFNSYSDGHMWVTDGYKWNKSCMFNEGNYVGFFVYQYFHMNWGWNGSWNGWYNVYNFNPGSNSYNYKNKMIYNLRP